MKIAVWDTYATREDGKLMNFDILVPGELKDEKVVFNYGNTFLKSKPFKTNELTSNECKFCHVEQASPAMVNQIENNGFAIVEISNCT